MEHRLDTELDREHSEPPWVECGDCGGEGMVTWWDGDFPDYEYCDKCFGLGQLCATCGEPWDTEHECAKDGAIPY